jgi:DNA polymerase III subunit epsilon
MAGAVSPLDSPAARQYLRAELPAPSTLWREAVYSVVDLELTGLDPAVDEIIAFASVTVSGGRVSLADVRYRLVRPKRMPDGSTIRIHGLRESDLAGAPPLSEVIDEMLEALTGRAMVAHFAPVEEGFLKAALAAHGLTLRNPVIDTVDLAGELSRLSRRSGMGRVTPRDPAVPDSSPGLSNLARSLGLPVHRPHHADGDALTAAQAFIALAALLDALEPQTVGSMERLYRSRGGAGPLSRALRRIGLGASH